MEHKKLPIQKGYVNLLRLKLEIRCIQNDFCVSCIFGLFDKVEMSICDHELSVVVVVVGVVVVICKQSSLSTVF